MEQQPKKKKVKTDKTEFLKRIFTIQGWIVEGVQSSLIVRSILNNEWCTSQRHAERMLKQARDLWTDIPEAELDQKRRLRVIEYRHLARSLQDRFKGTPTGIVALMSIHKQIDILEGIKPPKKLEMSGPGGQPIQTENNSVILYLPDNGRGKTTN